MRIKLSLFIKHPSILFLNYNYPLSAAIYNLLKLGSPEFASFLHDIGYKEAGKTYKLFSFALVFKKMRIRNSSIRLIDPSAYLYISTPLIEEFIKNFVIGTFHMQNIELHSGGIKTNFEIRQVEVMHPPDLTEHTSFKLLSPLVLSTVSENQQKFQRYFRYDDDINEINRVLNQNLANKYNLINDKEYSSEGVALEWDADYINKRLSGGKRISKKISITKPGIKPVEIIGIEAPFTLKGDPELMQVGYDCGYGEKGSTGFGLAEIR